MPNGAKFGSTFGSVNVFTRLKFLSYISTTPAWKFVTYKKSPRAVLAIAKPLYTAPELELSFAITALVTLTAGLQPRIVPSSVANRKTEGPDLEFAETLKLVVELNTRPVGVPPVGAPGAGIVTTSGEPTGKAWPRPL